MFRLSRRFGSRAVSRLELGLLLVACGSPTTHSSLSTDAEDGAGSQNPAVTVRAQWQYRSSLVDVDLALATTSSADDCFSVGRLMVDKLTAPRSVYTSPRFSCTDLRLSDSADIVLYELTTGHDWSRDALDVDTDHEVIQLGPWAPEGGDPVVFTLSAPSCGGGCDCPELRRRAGDESSVLALGRRCD